MLAILKSTGGFCQRIILSKGVEKEPTSILGNQWDDPGSVRENCTGEGWEMLQRRLGPDGEEPRMPNDNGWELLLAARSHWKFLSKENDLMAHICKEEHISCGERHTQIHPGRCWVPEGDHVLSLQQNPIRSTQPRPRHISEICLPFFLGHLLCPHDSINESATQHVAASEGLCKSQPAANRSSLRFWGQWQIRAKLLRSYCRRKAAAGD